MGSPKKNRRKTPQEKEKNGAKFITRAGLTMHYSVCGKANHNKKGHARYIEEQKNVEIIGDDDEQDHPEILQVNTPICL
jgi:hypothetical protein